MIDRKEIELLIKAKLQGKADIASVTKAIVELEKAIDEQAAAAKKGIGSIDDLKDSYRKLEAVAAQLASAGGLIGSFEKQSKAITKSEASVKSLGEKYDALKAKLDAAATVTDAQQDRLVKLSARYDRATASLEKQRGTLASLEASLKDAGIATDQLADASERIREAAAQTGAALVRNRTAQASYNDDLKAANKIIEEKGASEKAAARDADLFAAAERRAGEATAARAKQLSDLQRVRAENAARRAGVQSDVAASGIADAETRQAAKRASELAALRADIEQRSASGARDSGLAKTAEDAQKAAAAYTTLARASSDLAPKVTSVRDAVNSILNPAAGARASLAGVESSVQKLGVAIAGIKGPVTDYQEQFKQLNAASKEIANQAGLVDNFQRQAAALRQARGEFSAARLQVTQYAAAVRAGGESGASFTKALAEAQSRARGAASALAEQVVATRGARDALRAAGIDASNLANAEVRLAQTAKQAATATTDLTEAVKKYGVEAEKADSKSPFGGNNSRTALSFVQRLRGEVLALAAAYTGLQGAITLAKGATDSFNTREGAKNQLGLSVGQNKALIDAEFEYVRQQSERIGIEFESAVKGYAKFAASARLAGRAQQETRFIFESISEVGRVANLTTSDLDGVFKALEQIFSKGSIQAEELRGQLGDRLFGAFQVAAESLKDTFPDLNKALKDGAVSSDQLVKIVARYKEIVSGSLPAAQQSLAANQMRLTNAVFDFKLAIADGGFADAYKAALVEITTFLKSEDGKKFAQDIADKFTLLAKALVLVAQNASTIQSIFVALIALKAVSIVSELTTNMVGLAAKSGTAAVALTGVALAVSRIQAAFSLLSTFIVGWEIGTIAYEKFSWVQKVGAYVIGSFDALWKYIVAGWDIALASIPTLATNAFAGFVNIITFALRKSLSLFAGFASAVGATGVAASINSFVDSITLGFEDVGSKSVAIRKQLVADMKAIVKNVESAGFIADPNAKTTPAIAATAQPEPGKTPAKGPTEGDINKRRTQIEEIRKALETLQARIDRAQTDTLSSQLAAVDQQYAALARKIATLGGDEALAFTKTLAETTQQLKLQITTKFNDDLLKEQERLQNKIEGVEALAGKKQKNELDARLQAISTSYADVYRDIAAERAKLERNSLSTSNVDAQRARLDAGILELQNLERKKFATEQLTAKEKELTDAIANRDKLVASVRALEEARQIDDEEATRRIQEIQAAALPQIQAAAAAAREWALANSAIFANPEQQALFLANLDAIAAKAQSTAVVYTQLQKTIQDTFASGASQFVDGLAQSIAGLVNGTLSWNDALKNIGKTFLQITAQILKGIAEQIIKQQILNAVLAISKALGWGGAGASAGASTAAVSHSGGSVGAVSNRTRAVNPAWFSNAPRYHAGGVPGLAPNEYATILEKNEEVLAANSPRNVMNGGGMTAKSDGGGSNRFVLVDDRSKVPEAMSSAEGEQVTLIHVKRNIASIRQMLKGG